MLAIMEPESTTSIAEASLSEPQKTKYSPSSLLSEFLTREQLAAEFGISPRQLWERQRKGHAPPKIKLGRRTYYAKSSVISWILQQQQEAPTTRRRHLRINMPNLKGTKQDLRTARARLIVAEGA